MNYSIKLNQRSDSNEIFIFYIDIFFVAVRV